MSRVICIYRDGKFLLPEADTTMKVGDEVVLITHRNNLPELHQRWNSAKR